MNAKHTPTPYMFSIQGYDNVTQERIIRLSFKDGAIINNAENDRRFIENAVNMHDELIEALQQAKNYIAGDYIDADGLVEQLELVLSKAKGE